jgi:hypothetical protein
MFRRITWAILLGTLLIFVPGAHGQTTTQPARPDPLVAAVSEKGPLILHLPGVGGHLNCDDRMLAGLREGHVSARIVICDWTEGQPGIAALQAMQRDQEEALRIANLIVDHAKADPASPIYLTAHSGGCGLAAWALEKLPEGVMVDTVLLIAPALSPGYDLSRALAHVRGNVYVFSSTLDQIVLFIGTRTFGTIDGVHSEAAGFSGFVMPSTADREQYRKLIPKPYTADWMRYGNDGDHIGAMSRRFSRAEMAPLIGYRSAPRDYPATQPTVQN